MKFRLIATAALLAALLTLAPLASAQNADRYGPPPVYPPGYGGYGYGYDYSASTPAGSYARNMADLIRSQGSKNLNDAQAAEKIEDARKKYLENRVQATRDYFRMKEINQAYREENRDPRPSSEELFRLAKLKAPDRLSPSQLDPISGEIGWPVLLRDDAFALSRTQLNEMLTYWAEHGNRLSLDQYTKFKATLDQLSNELVAVVETAPPKPYADARNFLESVAYEMQIAQGY